MSAMSIVGTGFWSAGFPCASAWGQGQKNDSAPERPPAELISSRFRRYTSNTTRMAAQVFEEAVGASRVDSAELAVVFGSAEGELDFALEIISAIRRTGAPSPAMFMNSVHNAAPAHLSIATKNTGFFTSIAGGHNTVAMAMLEASMLLDDGHHTVALVVADEASPGPLDQLAPYESLAVALVLQRKPNRGEFTSLHDLRPLQTSDQHTDTSGELPRALAGNLRALAANPCAGAATLLERVLRAQPGTVVLSSTSAPDGQEAWCVDLRLPEAAESRTAS